jgi:signal transduction histidine kinase
MLHDLIVENRDQVIDRVRERTTPNSSEANLEHGIPLFLSQLAAALAPTAATRALHLVGAEDARKKITDSAALHGQDLLRDGFTVAQVVHGYGEVRQVVTELVSETNSAVSAADFQIFNRCLDDAIAGAVTAYGRQREQDLVDESTERLGVLVHELRNLINAAIVSFDIIRKGTVGLGGSTGAIHARSLAGLTTLVERSLAEVRLEAGLPRLEHVPVVDFIEEIETGAVLQAVGHGVELSVSSVASDVAIYADRQLLASAVSNLLQNAFKFSRAGGKVTLAARASSGSVLIEVCDECGGLPPGKAEELFAPFTRRGSDRSGLGLGLSIALSAVLANSGYLYVRDVPGLGCVFTIELPRHPPQALLHVSRDGDCDFRETSDHGPRRATLVRVPKTRAI